MVVQQESLSARSAVLQRRGHILDSATVYLSGPMDFVGPAPADRAAEREKGWRRRVAQFLLEYGTTIYDPWDKPEVAGMPHYGKEDEYTASRRNEWVYGDDEAGVKKRDELAGVYWPTMHIDLRMTDLADFLIAYCPTNIYSVGTVHEIAVARSQHKPVLLVTPHLEMSAGAELREHLAGDARGTELLDRMRQESPSVPNKDAVPSLWYMAMIGNEDYFFDGFGFAAYRERMQWEWYGPLDEREERQPPVRPLLPYLEKLDQAVPTRYDSQAGGEVENPEWLIFTDEDVASCARTQP